jgi:Cytochrome C oxidase, cbb3-type, subunit III
MDYPIFHLSLLGDRFLFVVIAILHTIINHGFAIGLVPIISIMEFKGFQTKNSQWDELAYKMMKTVFIVTTTIGAATGVGIWFSASLVNPNSIASLIRVFFSAWLFEWVIFVSEVALVMLYFLTWKKWTLGLDKEKHFAFGYFLSIFSWVTMAIIVAILGFMMDPGDWNEKHTFWYGFLNPIYLPQLAFRTFLALLLGGAVAQFLIQIFTSKQTQIRIQATKFVSIWILVVAPLALCAGGWYWNCIPDLMKSHLSVALGTIQFQNWYRLIIILLISGVVFSILLAFIQLIKRQFNFAIALYALLVIWISASLGSFERAREFVRKPFIIKNYMYANGYKVEDYPLLQKDGILKHASFVSTQEITPDNKIEAGKNVFLLACAQCHTINGMNSISSNFNRMYGSDKPWNRNAMHQYIKSMHNARTYMPPFPGNDKEIDALVTYFKVIQYAPDPEIYTFGYTKLSISKDENQRLLQLINAKDSLQSKLNK